MPVCPTNPYLRHLTQFFVEKYAIIWAEAHSIAECGFQIADFSSERVCEGGAALEEHLFRGAAFKPFYCADRGNPDYSNLARQNAS